MITITGPIFDFIQLAYVINQNTVTPVVPMYH